MEGTQKHPLRSRAQQLFQGGFHRKLYGERVSDTMCAINVQSDFLQEARSSRVVLDETLLEEEAVDAVLVYLYTDSESLHTS